MNRKKGSGFVPSPYKVTENSKWVGRILSITETTLTKFSRGVWWVQTIKSSMVGGWILSVSTQCCSAVLLLTYVLGAGIFRAQGEISKTSAGTRGE